MQPSTSESHQHVNPAALFGAVTLRNGRHVWIRPIQPEDATAEREFIQSLSPDSRRSRFLCQIGAPSENLIKALTDIDQVRDVAIAAVVNESGPDRIVGVSRYALNADGSECEAAITVLDDWQQQGLGTLLMERLIAIARERGIKRMISTDSAENTRMKSLATFLGFHGRPDPLDANLVVHTLTLN